MQLNDEQFVKYQKHVLEFIELLGLTEWKIYFKHYCEGESCFAECWTDYNNMVASFRLAKKLPKECAGDINIRGSALHESLHLLLTPLRDLAGNRFITEDQLIQADEIIVNRLMRVLCSWWNDDQDNSKGLINENP